MLNRPSCKSRRHKRHWFDPFVGKTSWRRKWQPTPVFLTWKIPWTEEPGGLQSMGLQLDMTENTHTHTHKHTRTQNTVTHSLSPFLLPQWLTALQCRGPGFHPWSGSWSPRSTTKVQHACPVVSVISYSLQPHGLELTRPFCPWDSPDKNTGVSCRALLQGIFLTMGGIYVSGIAGRFFTDEPRGKPLRPSTAK